MSEAINPYGDGLAAQRIVQALLWKYKFSDVPPTAFQ